MNCSYSDLLATFLRCTDQKDKTANALKEVALPLLAGRELFVDMGSGTGDVAATLLPHFRHSYLVEYDEENVRKLVKRFNNRNDVTVLHGDINELDTWLSPDLMLFSYTLGYTGLGLPEPEKLTHRLNLLGRYHQQLRPGGALAVVDTPSSGSYQELFDYLAIPVQNEIFQLCSILKSKVQTREHSFAVFVRAETEDEMVNCLRLMTYDDGTSRLDLIPVYRAFCRSLPVEDGKLTFRYETELLVLLS